MRVAEASSILNSTPGSVALTAFSGLNATTSQPALRQSASRSGGTKTRAIPACFSSGAVATGWSQ